MIEMILPAIRDGADYIKALTLFRSQSPTDAAELVGIYTKYAPHMEDAATAAIYIAIDLLPGRSMEDAGDFSSLGLSQADLESLFQAKTIAGGQHTLEQEEADAIVAATAGDSVSEPIKVLLARLALDALVSRGDCGAFSGQVSSLADYLASLGEDTLDKYTPMVSELRMKCRL